MLSAPTGRFPVSLGIALLILLGAISWAFVASYPPERQDIGNYNELSYEHLGAVDRAEFYAFTAGVSDQLHLQAYAWMACADNWLLDGSAEFGPGGLRVFPLPDTFDQQRVIKDLVELARLETNLADSHLPPLERATTHELWWRQMERTQGDEANLRAGLHLPPLQDVGVAYHVLARCGEY
jgi:hypothetical protein